MENSLSNSSILHLETEKIEKKVSFHFHVDDEEIYEKAIILTFSRSKTFINLHKRVNACDY